jgi:hypothetical protein
LKRVYRRGVGEEGEDWESGSRRVEEETAPGDDTDGDDDDQSGKPTTESRVLLASTPPPHARTYDYDDIPDNENPWA